MMDDVLPNRSQYNRYGSGRSRYKNHPGLCRRHTQGGLGSNLLFCTLLIVPEATFIIAQVTRQLTRKRTQTHAQPRVIDVGHGQPGSVCPRKVNQVSQVRATGPPRGEAVKRSAQRQQPRRSLHKRGRALAASAESLAGRQCS